MAPLFARDSLVPSSVIEHDSAAPAAKSVQVRGTLPNTGPGLI
jgi:hypothetical protein